MPYINQSSLGRGFRAVFASSLLWNTQPHLVVFTLLFLNKGLSLSHFFILESIGSLTAFLLEIPTGMIADRLGRKLSIIMSLSLALVINPLFILSDDLMVLYGAAILGGICGALRSGADEALFYDSLLAMGREQEYTRLNGSLRWWSAYTGIAASVAGGFLGAIDYALAWWCWEAIVALSLVSALFIVEPESPRHARPATPTSHLVESLSMTFRTEARYFIVYSVLMWLFFSIAFWLWQPYLRSIGLPVELFGIVFALTGFAGGFGSRMVTALERKLSPRVLLALPPTLLGVALMGESLCTIPVGFCLLILHSFASGTFSIVSDNAVNSRINSATRATVLSVKNMLSTLLFAALSPLVGLLADETSLSRALACLACGVVVVGLVSYARYPRAARGGDPSHVTCD